MKNLEQETIENQEDQGESGMTSFAQEIDKRQEDGWKYKTTLADWIPGYGALKQSRDMVKFKPNMLINGSPTMKVVHGLYHVMTVGSIAAYVLNSIVN